MPTLNRLLPLLLAALAAGPAAVPQDQVSLGNDVVRFTAPPTDVWTLAPAVGNAPPDKVLFTSADRTSAIQVELATFDVTRDTAGRIATSLVKSLKERRAKAGNRLLVPPTVEHDKRFDIVIRERFAIGPKTVQEQVHLIKSVGPKTVLVAVSSTSDDPATVAAAVDAAKASLASATYHRPAPPLRRRK